MLMLNAPNHHSSRAYPFFFIHLLRYIPLKVKGMRPVFQRKKKKNKTKQQNSITDEFSVSSSYYVFLKLNHSSSETSPIGLSKSAK